MQNDEVIKKQKGEYWSKLGAGEEYHKNVSSSSGFNKIKNLVETAIVLKNVQGLVLDAGTGSGRFARALAKIKTNKVVALDYSNEMLIVNKRLSQEDGITHIEYVQGDIEDMKFESNYFDGLVSITVVRHFPQWKEILKEYVRVLKPGGKLIFEMCSADHINLANKIWPRFGVSHSDGSFFYYEAEVSFLELKTWLDSLGVTIEKRITYDFFNSNCFIKIVTLNKFGYKAFMKILNTIFSIFPLPNICAFLELNLLARLPTNFSYNYMVICRKR